LLGSLERSSCAYRRRLLLVQLERRQKRERLRGRKNPLVVGLLDRERPHLKASERSAVTAERIGEIWLSVQGESLGPAIDIRPGYENFWMYIPHFIHSPFYVYAYAFGDCLVNSLYAVYEKSDSGFAERYLAMLAAGGTKHHSELLAPFGLDARDPKFWDGGLSVIAGLIGELEALDQAK